MLTARAGSRTGDAQVRTERDLQLQSVTMEELEEIKGTGEGRDDRVAQYSRMAVRRGRNVKEPLSGKKSGRRNGLCQWPCFPGISGKSVKRFLRIGHGKKRIVSLQESFHGPCSVRWIRRAVRVDFGGKTYTVTAVIDKEEMVMFLTADEGAVQKAAFSLQWQRAD